MLLKTLNKHMSSIALAAPLFTRLLSNKGTQEDALTLIQNMESTHGSFDLEDTASRGRFLELLTELEHRDHATLRSILIDSGVLETFLEAIISPEPDIGEGYFQHWVRKIVFIIMLLGVATLALATAPLWSAGVLDVPTESFYAVVALAIPLSGVLAWCLYNITLKHRAKLLRSTSRN